VLAILISACLVGLSTREAHAQRRIDATETVGGVMAGVGTVSFVVGTPLFLIWMVSEPEPGERKRCAAFCITTATMAGAGAAVGVTGVVILAVNASRKSRRASLPKSVPALSMGPKSVAMTWRF